MKSLGRSILGGESFFQNTFRAESGGEVTLSPELPGDIMSFDLAGHEIIVQSGSYLASHTDITVETKWGGAKTFFGGEGLFMLKCSGHGHVDHQQLRRDPPRLDPGRRRATWSIRGTSSRSRRT